MSDPAIDRLFDGKYRVVRLLRQSGWATVYEAVTASTNERVAVKVLNQELARKPELAARFAREAEATTRIVSPFVVTTYGTGTLSDGRPYIVMEFLEGKSLARVLAEDISRESAVKYVVDLLSALDHAHSKGVVHRDIRPDNVFVVRSEHGEETVKVVDFGISKAHVPRAELPAKSEGAASGPVYMSPEQARGARDMDHRSDLYSVGVVLYEAVTKAVPHAAATFNELLFKIALEDVIDPRTKFPDLDPSIAEIIVKSLSREPATRYQSAAEFRDALTKWLEGRSAQRHQVPAKEPKGGRSIGLVLAIVILLGLAGAFLLTRTMKSRPSSAPSTSAPRTETPP
ncbi:MAG TPA: serine/threonine-protein kinase [Labilithrix sp.]|nr:serine/threonine-protein kinase [Labilithrix sp.]